MGHLVLPAAGVAAAYVLLVLVWPQHRCWRCHGKRVERRKGRAPRKCRRCRGMGVHPWRGGPMVHRYFWAAIGNRLMERRQRGQREDG